MGVAGVDKAMAANLGLLTQFFVPVQEQYLETCISEELFALCEFSANGNNRSLILMYSPVQHNANYLIKPECAEILL